MIERIKKSIYSRLRHFIYWHFNYDRVAERKIKKSLSLWNSGSYFNRLRSEMMWYRIQKKYTTSFRPGIIVGDNLRIEHCRATEIGQTAIIGDHFRIYQNVLVLAKVTGDEELIQEKSAIM